MDYEKARLTPVNDDKNAPDNAAGQSAKELIKRQRQETQRYKQKYFVFKYISNNLLNGNNNYVY